MCLLISRRYLRAHIFNPSFCLLTLLKIPIVFFNSFLSLFSQSAVFKMTSDLTSDLAHSVAGGVFSTHASAPDEMPANEMSELFLSARLVFNGLASLYCLPTDAWDWRLMDRVHWDTNGQRWQTGACVCVGREGGGRGGGGERWRKKHFWKISRTKRFGRPRVHSQLDVSYNPMSHL